MVSFDKKNYFVWSTLAFCVQFNTVSPMMTTQLKKYEELPVIRGIKATGFNTLRDQCVKLFIPVGNDPESNQDQLIKKKADPLEIFNRSENDDHQFINLPESFKTTLLSEHIQHNPTDLTNALLMLQATMTNDYSPEVDTVLKQLLNSPYLSTNSLEELCALQSRIFKKKIQCEYPETYKETVRKTLLDRYSDKLFYNVVTKAKGNLRLCNKLSLKSDPRSGYGRLVETTRFKQPTVLLESLYSIEKITKDGTTILGLTRDKSNRSKKLVVTRYNSTTGRWTHSTSLIENVHSIDKVLETGTTITIEGETWGHKGFVVQYDSTTGTSTQSTLPIENVRSIDKTIKNGDIIIKTGTTTTTVGKARGYKVFVFQYDSTTDRSTQLLIKNVRSISKIIKTGTTITFAALTIDHKVLVFQYGSTPGASRQSTLPIENVRSLDKIIKNGTTTTFVGLTIDDKALVVQYDSTTGTSQTIKNKLNEYHLWLTHQWNNIYPVTCEYSEYEAIMKYFEKHTTSELTNLFEHCSPEGYYKLTQSLNITGICLYEVPGLIEYCIATTKSNWRKNFLQLAGGLVSG